MRIAFYLSLFALTLCRCEWHIFKFRPGCLGLF
jgi:hypothetical protein